MRRAAFWLTLVMLVVMAFAAFAQPAGNAPAAKQVAPAFKLTDIQGKEVSLAKYQGKVIILDFWATWCPPCRGEIPDFVALQKQYGKKGLVIIGLSLDRDSEKGTAKSVVTTFYKANKMNYPVALATEKSLADAYGGIQYIPTTFIINRAGMIVTKHIGGTERATFENEIKPLLAEKAPRK